MKKIVLLLSAVFLVLIFSINNAESRYINKYALKTCTGIDPDGNMFDGAQCKDEQENGPCDKESVCYQNESISPV